MYIHWLSYFLKLLCELATLTKEQLNRKYIYADALNDGC